ncbi:Transmembrane protein [Thalictrum thalictroides]|uniref:Transmembrane protein n=1 Tax=Thalictrum thalictroides TaxID=46969 RepID=A0A7J6WEQ2_THATH|nr:Transmembrane protein [Thalictrum thalictroides]
MPITHADLAPGRQYSDLGSKCGAFLMVLCVLCGLSCFVLCLVGETTRSVATWVLTSTEGGGNRYECIYSGSGKTPLICALGAFLHLACAMVMEHAYMLIAVSKTPPPALITWNPDDSGFTKSLTWRAGFFFLTTWICFAVGEVLLMIAVGVESGHLRKWSRPRLSCLVVRPGLFLSAGVFGLTTVFLASGLYLTALRAQRLRFEEENVHRVVLDTSILYASPPRSPRQLTLANVIESPHSRHDQPPHRDLPINNKTMNSPV